MTPQSAGERRCVLITGCSSGLGQACALDLAAQGLRVFAGVRREEDAQRLRELSRGSVEPLLLDIVKSEAIEEARAALDEATGTRGLYGLVNNAGILTPGPWELLSTDSLRRQFEVNVVGTHAVTQSMLPLLRRAGGRIVLMGSLSGRVAPPFYGAYAASKHAMEAMADSLRMELRPWRIAVSILEPDAVSTSIWDKLDQGAASIARSQAAAFDLYGNSLLRMRAASQQISRSAMPVAAVVHAVRHALLARRPKPRYAIGWRAKLAVWAYARLPSSVMDWFLLRVMGLHTSR